MPQRPPDPKWRRKQMQRRCCGKKYGGSCGDHRDEEGRSCQARITGRHPKFVSRIRNERNRSQLNCVWSGMITIRLADRDFDGSPVKCRFHTGKESFVEFIRSRMENGRHVSSLPSPRNFTAGAFSSKIAPSGTFTAPIFAHLRVAHQGDWLHLCC